eukprot:COSAG06_NODE_266_length_18831_cov_301.960015_4_plen_754_part_00
MTRAAVGLALLAAVATAQHEEPAGEPEETPQNITGVVGGWVSDPCGEGGHADDGLGGLPTALMALLFLSVVMTARYALSAIPVPTFMFFFGYACSALAESDDVEVIRDSWGDDHILSSAEILFDSVVSWKGAHPNTMLYLAIPLLVLNDALRINMYELKKCMPSLLLLDGPGALLFVVLTAATTMLMFGFAEDCVVEVDPHTKAQMVQGAKEHTVGKMGEFPRSGPDTNVCDPANNPDWQTWERTEGEGFACVECIPGVSHRAEQLPVAVHLLLAFILAGPDPGMILGQLTALGAPARLTSLQAFESLLSDGVIFTGFAIMQSVTGGCDSTLGLHGVLFFVRQAGGGLVWGVLCGECMFCWLKVVHQPMVEIGIVTVCAYSMYWAAENIVSVNSVVAMVAFGLVTSKKSYYVMSAECVELLLQHLHQLSIILSALLFFFGGVKSRDKMAILLDNFAEDFDVDHRAGICMAFNPDCDLDDPGIAWYRGESACADDAHERTEAECITHHVCLWKGHADLTECEPGTTCCVASEISEINEVDPTAQLAMNFVLYILMMLARAVVLFTLSPLLANVGYGLVLKEGLLMVWTGIIRGPNALILSLVIDGNHLIGVRARDLVFLHTVGIVTYSMIINGSTSGVLYRRLAIYGTSTYSDRLQRQALRFAQAKSLSRLQTTCTGDGFYKHASFSVVRSMVPDFSNAELKETKMKGVKNLSLRQVAWADIEASLRNGDAAQNIDQNECDKVEPDLLRTQVRA